MALHPTCLPAPLHRYGVEVRHLWGMTELSPLGTLSAPKASVAFR